MSGKITFQNVNYLIERYDERSDFWEEVNPLPIDKLKEGRSSIALLKKRYKKIKFRLVKRTIREEVVR